MAEKVVIGNAELWHGDCREILPTLPKHDLVLTDPPYGIGIDGQKFEITRNPKHSRKHHEFMGWDKKPPDRLDFELIRFKSDNQIIWGGNYFVDKLPYPTKGWFFWDKGQRGLSMSDGELAWTSFNFPLRAATFNRVELLHEGTEHPTQKPLKLMVWCMSQVLDAQTILDPFMGSGTTGVACAQLGRSFTGIEREKKYFDIACERISRAYAQGQLIPHEEVQPVQTSLV